MRLASQKGPGFNCRFSFYHGLEAGRGTDCGCLVCQKRLQQLHLWAHLCDDHLFKNVALKAAYSADFPMDKDLRESIKESALQKER